MRQMPRILRGGRAQVSDDPRRFLLATLSIALWLAVTWPSGAAPAHSWQTQSTLFRPDFHPGDGYTVRTKLLNVGRNPSRISLFASDAGAALIGEPQTDPDVVLEQIVSPDKKKALLVIIREGRTEVWVMNVDGTEKHRIRKVRGDEGVMSASWSPDSTLVAFVSYNLAGHSPMTTAHVWIAQSNGRGLRRVVLPSPYERFSTYSPKWKTNDSLIVTGAVLGEPAEHEFEYSYMKGRIKRFDPESEGQER